MTLCWCGGNGGGWGTDESGDFGDFGEVNCGGQDNSVTFLLSLESKGFSNDSLWWPLIGMKENSEAADFNVDWFASLGWLSWLKKNDEEEEEEKNGLLKWRKILE